MTKRLAATSTLLPWSGDAVPEMLFPVAQADRIVDRSINGRCRLVTRESRKDRRQKHAVRGNRVTLVHTSVSTATNYSGYVAWFSPTPRERPISRDTLVAQLLCGLGPASNRKCARDARALGRPVVSDVDHESSLD